MKDDRHKPHEHRASEGTERSNDRSAQKEIICPVCGKPLEDYNIPTVEAVVKDELRFLFPFRFRIIDSKPILEYDFAHASAEGAEGKKTSHKLTAVIRTEFDSEGNCPVFEIVQVLPGKKRKR